MARFYWHAIHGNAIKAKVEITNHDVDSSHIYSNLPVGNYHRYLHQGNYSLTYSKNGYYPKTINATILNNDIVIEDVELVPFGNTTSISEIVNSKSNKIINIDILGRESETNKIKLIKTIEGNTIIIE